jgi:23S rRNA pseudouridine1911/1915/1917 synthase
LASSQHLFRMNKEKTFDIIINTTVLRLDKYVAQVCPELSRTLVQKLIEGGHITVNGKAAKSGLKLEKGQQIRVVIPPPEPSPLVPESIPLNILYEDDDLLVVDKPAGMTVHPAPGNQSHTLVNAVLAHVPDLERGETERPGIVHRLDKDTSGLIIIAKTPTAHRKLADQFKNRQVVKVYVTLVKGHLTPETGTIEADIGRDPRHRQRMAVVKNGRPSSTAYRVIKYTGNYTLLEIRPKTGRTHQIRVHLAAIGFPVAGDAIYGGPLDLLSRQFLHAAQLEFSLPSSGERCRFESPLPSDLSAVLRNLGD